MNQRANVGYLLAVLVCLVSFIAPSTAAALSSEQQKVFGLGINYFDESAGTNGGCTASTTTGGPLIGSDNIQRAFNYFVAKGLTAAQSAGILGNLVQESVVNPKSQQDGSSDPYPKNGVGFGIAQWTFTDRQKPLIDLAASKGLPVTDLGVQLDNIWRELSPGGNRAGALPALKATTTVEEAALSFEKTFEGADPAQANNHKRITNAQEIFTKYGGAAVVTTNIVSVITGGSCDGIVGNGQDTKFIDGFTVYSQCDPAWGSKSLGDGTICANGCGPSAMAMVVTNLTGQKITPDVTSALAQTDNQYIPGTGSKWSISPDLAAKYNLKSVALSNDVTAITTALQSGALVVVAGNGASPFTAGGHFLVIRGVTAAGKWKIGDSGHRDTSDKEWEPQQLVSEIHAGSVYAISK